MKLRCINIVSKAPADLTAFYEKVFAAKATELVPGRWELKIGDVTLVFTYTSGTVVVPADSCGLEFENGDGEYERMLSAGIEISAAPVTYPWKWRAFAVNDPDGNNLDFVQYVGE